MPQQAAGNIYVNVNTNAVQSIPKQVQNGLNLAQKQMKPLILPVRITGLKGGNLSNHLALGKVTVEANEFEKAIKAATARTISFGLAAGALYKLTQGFSLLLTTSIEVEKKLKEIQVISNASGKDFQSYAKGIFQAANSTSESFQNASTAALEFARQGLGLNEQLKRTRDSLILTKTAGIEITKSVEAITAALNTFSSELRDSTDLVDRLTTLDNAFAVSTGDLAEGLSRVGNTAQEAGVSLNETLAAITALQQRTTRGGAVIGNALKSIFTRVGRAENVELLNQLGISTETASGKARDSISVLKDLAKVYNTLGDAQKRQISEQFAGLYQINQFQALIKDLGSSYSVLDQAINQVNDSQGSAIKRIDELNKSTSSLLQQTTTNLTQLSSQIGALTFEKPLKNFLSAFTADNSLLSGIIDILSNIGGESEGIGEKFAEGLLRGIGNILAGSGLAFFTVILGKALGIGVRYAVDVAKSLLTVNNQLQQQIQLQNQINLALSNASSAERMRIANATSLNKALEYTLQLIRAQQTIAINPLVSYAYQKGVRPGQNGPRFADGYTPIKQEINAVKTNPDYAGNRNARPQILNDFSIEGRKQSVVINSAEKVVPTRAIYKGYSGPDKYSILNPRQQKMLGFPDGYIPNLAKISKRRIGGGAYGEFSIFKRGDKVFPYGVKEYSDNPSSQLSAVTEFVGSKYLNENVKVPGVYFPKVKGNINRILNRKPRTGPSFLKEYSKDTLADDYYDSLFSRIGDFIGPKGRLTDQLSGSLRRVIEKQSSTSLLELGDVHNGNYTINDRAQKIISNIILGKRSNSRDYEIFRTLTKKLSNSESQKRFLKAIDKAGGKFTVFDGFTSSGVSSSLKKSSNIPSLQDLIRNKKTYSSFSGIANGYIPNLANIILSSGTIIDPSKKYVYNDIYSSSKASRFFGYESLSNTDLEELSRYKKIPALKVIDPTNDLKRQIAGTKLDSSLFITRSRDFNFDKFQESRFLSQKSIDLKNILGNKKIGPQNIQKISENIKGLLGNKFFVKGKGGYGGKETASAFELENLFNKDYFKYLFTSNKSGYKEYGQYLTSIKRQLTRNPNNFFAQSGIKGGGPEYRITLVGTSSGAEVVGKNSRHKFNRAERSYDFSAGASTGSSLLTDKSAQKATISAINTIRRIPKNLREGRVFGVDALSGGVIELNAAQSGTYPGSLNNIRTNALSADVLGQISDKDVNRFTNTGLKFLNYKGNEASRIKNFNNFSKSLDKLKLYDENAYYQIAANLGRAGFDIKVGEKFLRRGNIDRFFGRRGFAQGYSPLMNAIKRESQFVDPSKIYISSVKTPNYSGPVVANTRDEPTQASLLTQAHSRLSGGYIPNLAKKGKKYPHILEREKREFDSYRNSIGEDFLQDGYTKNRFTNSGGVSGKAILASLLLPTIAGFAESYGGESVLNKSFTGALSGAGTGTAIGSFIGPYGAVIGGVLGGGIGALSPIANARNDELDRKTRLQIEGFEKSKGQADLLGNIQQQYSKVLDLENSGASKVIIEEQKKALENSISQISSSQVKNQIKDILNNSESSPEKLFEELTKLQGEGAKKVLEESNKLLLDSFNREGSKFRGSIFSKFTNFKIEKDRGLELGNAFFQQNENFLSKGLNNQNTKKYLDLLNNIDTSGPQNLVNQRFESTNASIISNFKKFSGDDYANILLDQFVNNFKGNPQELSKALNSIFSSSQIQEVIKDPEQNKTPFSVRGALLNINRTRNSQNLNIFSKGLRSDNQLFNLGIDSDNISPFLSGESSDIRRKKIESASELKNLEINRQQILSDRGIEAAQLIANNSKKFRSNIDIDSLIRSVSSGEEKEILKVLNLVKDTDTTGELSDRLEELLNNSNTELQKIAKSNEDIRDRTQKQIESIQKLSVINRNVNTYGGINTLGNRTETFSNAGIGNFSVNRFLQGRRNNLSPYIGGKAARNQFNALTVSGAQGAKSNYEDLIAAGVKPEDAARAVGISLDSNGKARGLIQQGNATEIRQTALNTAKRLTLQSGLSQFSPGLAGVINNANSPQEILKYTQRMGLSGANNDIRNNLVNLIKPLLDVFNRSDDISSDQVKENFKLSEDEKVLDEKLIKVLTDLDKNNTALAGILEKNKSPETKQKTPEGSTTISINVSGDTAGLSEKLSELEKLLTKLFGRVNIIAEKNNIAFPPSPVNQ